jgi:hypothetical protein
MAALVVSVSNQHDVAIGHPVALAQLIDERSRDRPND